MGLLDLSPTERRAELARRVAKVAASWPVGTPVIARTTSGTFRGVVTGHTYGGNGAPLVLFTEPGDTFEHSAWGHELRRDD